MPCIRTAGTSVVTVPLDLPLAVSLDLPLVAPVALT